MTEFCARGCYWDCEHRAYRVLSEGPFTGFRVQRDDQPPTLQTSKEQGDRVFEVLARARGESVPENTT